MREDGQTAAEYLGVLLLVCVIATAAIWGGMPGQVVAGMRQGLCAIIAGTDCGEPNRSGGYADDPYEDSGLANREVSDAGCGPDGDEQAHKAYENLGRVYDYYH